MKMQLALSLLLGCTATAPALADPCAANAGIQAHQTRPHFVVFSGDVQASGCVQYACTGWVHYVVTTQFATGATAKERLVDQYRVQAGSGGTHISNEHAISGESVVDVGVEDVSCTSP
jgi:hypothetical protein